jgi:hypothetical protein
MEKQTYWHQLAGKGANAVIFWVLNLLILICLFLILFGYNSAGGAGLVMGVLAGAQVVNVLVTYFLPERRALR